MRRNRHESVGIRGTAHCRKDTPDTSSQWEKFHRVFDNRLIETHRELSISTKSLSRILDRLTKQHRENAGIHIAFGYIE